MWLLVNFIFWNETTCLIHCDPVPGESGWTKILVGINGSALPVTDHSELWNLYLLSSAGMMSKTKTYSSLGFKPLMFTRITGNIRLLRENEIKYSWKTNPCVNWSKIGMDNAFVLRQNPNGFCSSWWFVFVSFQGFFNFVQVNLGESHEMI